MSPTWHYARFHGQVSSRWVPSPYHEVAQKQLGETPSWDHRSQFGICREGVFMEGVSKPNSKILSLGQGRSKGTCMTTLKQIWVNTEGISCSSGSGPLVCREGNPEFEKRSPSSSWGRNEKHAVTTIWSRLVAQEGCQGQKHKQWSIVGDSIGCEIASSIWYW